MKYSIEMLNALIDSLAPGRFVWNFRYLIFKLTVVIDDWGIFGKTTLR